LELGPGYYEPEKTAAQMYKFKPSASFIDQTPKDILAFQLNQKTPKIFRPKKPKILNHQTEMLKKDLMGKKIGPVKFNQISPYHDIEIDVHANPEPGPGDYNLEKFSDFNTKVNKNQKRIESLGFNSNTYRFDANLRDVKCGIIGPGHYPELRGFDRQINAVQMQNKGNVLADHNFSRMKKHPKVFKTVSTHSNDLMMLKEEIYNENPPGPGYYSQKPSMSELMSRRRRTHEIIREKSPKPTEEIPHKQ
jgi:hypothetical protein